MIRFLRGSIKHPLFWVLGVYSLCWFAVILSMPLAAQNMPLNDGWAYSKSLFYLLRGEGIHYFGWASPPQFGLWLFGAPFVVLFGEYQWALRFSSILLFMAGGAAYYGILRGTTTFSEKLSALCVAAFMFSPLCFVLSGTFMTDIPVISLSLIALYFYGRGMKHGGGWSFFWAMLFAVLAGVTRQNAIAVPITAMVMLLADTKLRRCVWCYGATIIPICATLLVNAWMSERDDVAVLYKSAFSSIQNIQHILETALAYIPLVLQYGAWVVLPLLVMFNKKLRLPFLLLLPMLLLFDLHLKSQDPSALFPNKLPYLGNMISLSGPLSEKASPSADTPMPWISPAVPWILQPFLTMAALLLLGALVMMRKQYLRHPLFMFAVVQFAMLSLTHHPFDRYFLVFFPFIILLVGFTVERSQRYWAAVSVLALLCLFNIAYTHDYLAQQNARWQLAQLVQEKYDLPATKIDAGFEWRSWHAARGILTQPDACYAEFFSPSYAVAVERTQYDSWLLRRPIEIFMQKKPCS